MPVSPGYAEAIREIFAFVPELRIQRMFGGAGVFSGEMMFALIIADELFLKTDEQTRPAFDAEGCAPWIYARDGVDRDMGYCRAPDDIWDDDDAARHWAGLALGAAGRKFRPKKRKGAAAR